MPLAVLNKGPRVNDRHTLFLHEAAELLQADRGQRDAIEKIGLDESVYLGSLFGADITQRTPQDAHGWSCQAIGNDEPALVGLDQASMAQYLRVRRSIGDGQRCFARKLLHGAFALAD